MRFKGKMTLEEFEQNVADCAKHGLRVVNLDGSGEATAVNNLPDYIRIVKKYNAQAVIFSNGFKMHGQYMKDCVDAGLDFYRFSFIGSNSDKYNEWMYNKVGGTYEQIIQNIREMKAYVDETDSKCVVATYHLITDNDNLQNELDEYKALVEDLGVKTEIWKLHTTPVV